MLHQIGVGVLGPVFRAYQPEPGRLVAVKQFKLDLPPETAHRLVAALETLIAADLTHPGIATPLAAGLTDNSPYLAQDFVAAESFDVVIRDYGPSQVAEALRTATQLGSALDVAATVNVFHGALHPRDVLVSSDETRVTGLGIAQALEGVGMVAAVRRPYAAPERVAGAPWDRRADVFSLAALVFEVLYGRRLAGFGAEAADAATRLPGVDMVALRDLFARALAENPADRFDTAIGFADALQTVLGDVSGAAKPARSRRRRDADALPARVIPGRTGRPALPLDADDLVMPPVVIPRVATQPGAVEAPPVNDDAIVAAVASEPLAAATEEPAAQTDVGAPIVSLTHDPDVDPRPAFHADTLLDPDLHPEPPAHESFASAAMERSRSAVWPIVLALVVGLTVGFAFGYGAGLRDHAGATTLAAVVSPPVASTTPPASVAAPAPVPASASVTAPAPGRVPAAQPAPPQVVPGSASPRTPARPATDTGRLLIRSAPAGARVLVDGYEFGVTPVTLTGLARGTRVVRVALQGYVTAERRVRIRSAQPAQPIDVVLAAVRPARAAAAPPAAQERTTGTLTVDSRPSGARVFVDEKAMGTTPLQVGAVRAGEHAVRLELQGFKPWSTTTTVAGGADARVSGSLERR